MCLLTEVFCPPRKRTIIPCFFTFNILWNYQSGFRHTELKKPIVWSRIEKYFVNGSARPLTLPSTLNHGDSSLILFFSDSHLVCHPPCPVVVLFPAFCASVALLQAPCSYGKHWCVEPCGASWRCLQIFSVSYPGPPSCFFLCASYELNCTYIRIKPPLKFSSSLKWIPARLYEDTFTFLVKSKLTSL